jgi:DNA-binding NarL/FixJ family response regulator
VVGRDPAGDCDPQPLSPGGTDAEDGRLGRLARDLHLQRAARCRGTAGGGEQVERSLAQGAGTAGHDERLVRVALDELEPPADALAYELQRRAHRVLEPGRLDLFRFAAGEIDQQAQVVPELERGLPDELEPLCRLRPGLGVREEQVDEAEDGKEGVAGVVGGVGGELPGRGMARGGRQLPLDGSPLLVGKRVEHRKQGSGRVGHRIRAALHVPSQLGRTIVKLRTYCGPDQRLACMSGPITCVVADDHPAMLAAVVEVLERHGIEVVGRAADGLHALAQIEATQPHVALVDIRMPRLGGIEVAQQAAMVSPDTAIVFYTAFGDRALLSEALDVGARGFVLKEAPLADLVRAVERVADGQAYVDPVLAGMLVGGPLADKVPTLTQREREVLRHLADGLSNEEIGKQLVISPETVRTHVRKAMSKLEADTRTQAVAIALRQSIIS